jgi:hypothetical protein
MGGFKNKLGEIYRLTPLAAMTKLGLEVKRWVKRLMQIRLQEKRSNNPAFVEQFNGIICYSKYEREIWKESKASKQTDWI